MTKQEQMAALRVEADLLGDRIVWGEGPLDARLVMVGEAPGAEEERLGRPFVGPAGRFLDIELSAAGISREGIYLTGAVKRRPTAPGKARPRNRAPTVREIGAWSGILKRQIEIISPRVILCLGVVAARALTGSGARIGDTTRLRSRGLSGVQVIVTYHPSYVRRFHGAANSHVLSDFRRALAASKQASARRVR